MRKFVTEIRAIDPITNELKTYSGPDIEAISFKLADEYCQLNGLGYCKVVGELITDFTNDIDYHTIQNN